MPAFNDKMITINCDYFIQTLQYNIIFVSALIKYIHEILFHLEARFIKKKEIKCWYNVIDLTDIGNTPC